MLEKIKDIIKFLKEMKKKEKKGENINLMIRTLSSKVVDLAVLDFERKVDKIADIKLADIVGV